MNNEHSCRGCFVFVAVVAATLALFPFCNGELERNLSLAASIARVSVQTQITRIRPDSQSIPNHGGPRYELYGIIKDTQIYFFG
jgi:hypothetical protein